jgi:N-acetylmuramoyl-L-alanine amidase
MDPGAIGPNGLEEKLVTLSISRSIRNALKELNHTIVMTRDNDETVSLSSRCEFANSWDAELFLSIHANAATAPAAEGFEVWTSPGFTAAEPWATAIWEAINQAFPTRRGRVDFTDGDPDKEKPFYVLTGTAMPAVLVEVAFISNAEEERLLSDPGWRMRMAGTIASGVLSRI